MLFCFSFRSLVGETVESYSHLRSCFISSLVVIQLIYTSTFLIDLLINQPFDFVRLLIVNNNLIKSFHNCSL